MEDDKKTNTNQDAQSASSFGVPVKTVLLIVLLALVAGLLVYVALAPKKNAPAPIQKQVINPADTVLSVEPAVAQTEANTYSSKVMIDTGKNTVGGVQLELSYDPSILTNVTVVAGDFFTSKIELLKKVDQKTGRITFAIAIPPGQNGVKGKGTLVKITYFVVGGNQTLTSIKFLDKTQVSGEGTISSLLKSTTNGVIDLSAPTVAAPTSAPY